MMGAEFHRQEPTRYTCEVCKKEQVGSLGVVLFPPGFVYVFPPGWNMVHSRSVSGNIIESTTVNVCSDACAAKYMR
jgi:hypothetical protein